MTERVSLHASMREHELMLFALNSSLVFAEQVAQQLGIALSPHEEREFEDGEHKARPLLSVRGRDVFVLQSLYADRQQSSNDKLCRLLFFIGALKDAAAARVTAVVPYLAYAREDRKNKPRDPVTTRYVATLFEAVGTDAILTIDVHNLSAFQNAFRCRTEHLEGVKLFVSYFAPLLNERDVVVVSPDAGSIKRVEAFRQRLSGALGKPVSAAFFEKYRNDGVVSGDMLVGNIKGKDAIIIDDLISSGATLARTARACRDRGVVRVFAAATHGLFVSNAPALLANSDLQEIAVTDTVPPFNLDGTDAKEKVRRLSCAGLFAEAIQRLHYGGSIVELMDA